jgi:CheY-like chemotaxis protein
MSQIRNAIICIDDDPMILQVLGFQLEKFIDTSHTLIELYNNPSKALVDIKEFVFDEVEVVFLIVDYQMPEMSGAKFIRALKQIYPSMPCVMLSGQANSNQIRELEEAGYLEAFLNKPWEESQILNLIHKFMK